MRREGQTVTAGKGTGRTWGWVLCLLALELFPLTWVQLELMLSDQRMRQRIWTGPQSFAHELLIGWERCGAELTALGIVLAMTALAVGWTLRWASNHLGFEAAHRIPVAAAAFLPPLQPLVVPTGLDDIYGTLLAEVFLLVEYTPTRGLPLLAEALIIPLVTWHLYAFALARGASSKATTDDRGIGPSESARAPEA